MVVPDEQQVARLRKPFDGGGGEWRQHVGRLRFRPRFAAVAGIADHLAAAAAADEHHDASVLQFDDARLLHGDALSVVVEHFPFLPATTPREAVVVGEIAEQRAHVVAPRVALLGMLAERHDETAAGQLDDAVVVQDIIANFARDAVDGRAPRFAFVVGETEERSAVEVAVFLQIEEGDASVGETEEADGHDVLRPFVFDDDLVLFCPCFAVVVRMALCDDGGSVVAAMRAVEACVGEEDASAFQRDEGAFAVSRVARAGRQLEATAGQDGVFCGHGGGGQQADGQACHEMFAVHGFYKRDKKG